MCHIYILLVSLVFIACGSKDNSENDFSSAGISIDSTEFEKHLAELSHDRYRGRMPGTEGGRETVAYLIDQLEAYGVQPALDGDYRQAVPLVEIDGQLQGPMTVSFDDGEIMSLEPRNDFVAVTERPVDSIGLDNSQLVFCGYGIVAPENDWNDYADVDLNGKTAVVLVNDPGLGQEDEDFFKGNTMTYYGRWTYKYEEADRQGLDGILLIHETNMAGYPWFVVKTGWSGPQLHIDQGQNMDDCGVKGWIHLEKAKELFERSGLDLSSLIKAARKPGFKPVEMGPKVSVALKNELRYDTSHNVIGMLEGKERPDENVVYTAHWDHLGVGDPVEGDSIYNGALDNASGTATLLAIAQAMSAADSLERTAVFCFVTAEEQGLLGSEWYANNPVLPLDKAVANINLDAGNFLGRSKDLTIVGYGHSDLDQLAEFHAKKQDRYVQNEQEPEKGFFFRSDHFNFAKKGVPALYAKGGYDHREKGVDYALKVRDEYVSQHYHQPSDEYDPDNWDLSGFVEDANLMLNIGLDLLKSDKWPRWSDDSEFKSLRSPVTDELE